jgi:Cu+-exporting ATPase
MCTRSVTTALSRTPGVYSVNVNLVSETADVLYNPKKVTIEELGEKINSIGFEYMGLHDDNSNNNELLEKKHKDSLNK